MFTLVPGVRSCGTFDLPSVLWVLEALLASGSSPGRANNGSNKRNRSVQGRQLLTSSCTLTKAASRSMSFLYDGNRASAEEITIDQDTYKDITKKYEYKYSRT